MLAKRKIIPTPSDLLNLFYPAANAAYGCQDPAHLVCGNSFVFNTQIKVDPAKLSQVPAQYLPMLSSMLKLGAVFGFVAVRPGAVFVSIRGTETPGEWLADFEAAPVSCQIGSGTVHQGFQFVYETIRDSALKGLSGAIKPGDQLYVTGHSLGAALAVLFADDAVSITSKMQVGTFAGPRVGLGDFVQSFNSRVPDTVRVVNRWDIVPNVPVPAPPLCLYQHVGSALNIDSGFTLDLGHAHLLPSGYLPGLKSAVAGRASVATSGHS